MRKNFHILIAFVILLQACSTVDQHDVVSFDFTSDSSQVVFLGDVTTDGIDQLFVVNLSENNLTRLSQNTNSTNGDVLDFVISPDGSYAVFRGDTEVDAVIRLYAVNLANSEITTLSQNTGDDTTLNVTDYVISPDSSTVVFRGDTVADTEVNLYSVAISGGTATELTTEVTPDASDDTLVYKISPDSSKVVFRSERDVTNVTRLYSVAISGGSVTTLSNNSSVDTNLDVYADFSISNDSATVVFIGDTEIDRNYRLYSAPIDGGTLTTLSSNTSSDTAFAVDSFSITSDDANVVFVGDMTADEVFEVYSVGIDGGSVNELVPTDSSVTSQSTYAVDKITENGERVIFRIFNNNGSSLVSTTLTGDDTEVLSDSYCTLKVTPDESMVVFVQDYTLYSIPIEGGEATELATNVNNLKFSLTEDGTRVVYVGYSDSDHTVENLYSLNLETGEITTLWENSERYRDIDSFKLSADSTWAAVYGDLDASSENHLYSIQLSDGTRTKISED